MLIFRLTPCSYRHGNCHVLLPVKTHCLWTETNTQCSRCELPTGLYSDLRHYVWSRTCVCSRHFLVQGLALTARHVFTRNAAKTVLMIEKHTHARAYSSLIYNSLYDKTNCTKLGYKLALGYIIVAIRTIADVREMTSSKRVHKQEQSCWQDAYCKRRAYKANTAIRLSAAGKMLPCNGICANLTNFRQPVITITYNAWT